MMRGMYSAISGLRNHQIMLDVTANDLANVNTVGFKASRTSFRDSLAQLQRSGASATTGNAGAKSAQIGLGVQLGSIDNVMTNGAFQSTGGPYDVAITGNGWFRVSNTPPTAGTAPAPDTFASGSTFEYTRAGNFTLNDLGELTTQDGWRVVGKAVTPGNPAATPPTTDAPDQTSDIVIKVPVDAQDVSIAPDGSVTYTPSGGGSRITAGYMSLASFPNQAGLDRVSANRWQSTGSSGAPDAKTPGINGLGQTVGGELEMSNVDRATEFTNMITAQRGFEASSRVLSTCDEMLQTLVNLKH
jgi:flagellar hook protein FlgE